MPTEIVPPGAMFWPIAGQAALTFVVAIIMFATRVVSVNRATTTVASYKLLDKPMPAAVTQATRNFANLFEIPVLFFAAAILVIALNKVDGTFVWMAWAFVAARVFHSIVHLTVNVVNLRMLAFFVSVGFAMAIWIRLALQMGSAA